MSGAHAKPVDQEWVEKKLRSANSTQESVQSLSLWALNHKSQHEQIVNIWFKVLKSVKLDHRVTMFYLCNEVVQTCKRKHALPYKDSFRKVLKEAVALVRDPSVQSSMTRIFQVWQERSVYEPQFVKELVDVLNNSKKKPTAPKDKPHVAKDKPTAAKDKHTVAKEKPVAATNKSTSKKDETNVPKKKTLLNMSDFQLSEVTKLVRHVAVLEEDLNNRSLDIAETELDIEQLLDKLPDETDTEPVDTANGSNAQLSKFISDFDDFLKLKREMIDHLDQSEQFYENQMGEANVVVTAYKNFGNRVANFSKKLSERRKYLLHPAKQRSKSSSETTRIKDTSSSSSTKASKTEKSFLDSSIEYKTNASPSSTAGKKEKSSRKRSSDSRESSDISAKKETKNDNYYPSLMAHMSAIANFLPNISTPMTDSPVVGKDHEGSATPIQDEDEEDASFPDPMGFLSQLIQRTNQTASPIIGTNQTTQNLLDSLFTDVKKSSTSNLASAAEVVAVSAEKLNPSPRDKHHRSSTSESTVNHHHRRSSTSESTLNHRRPSTSETASTELTRFTEASKQPLIPSHHKQVSVAYSPPTTLSTSFTAEVISSPSVFQSATSNNPLFISAPRHKSTAGEFEITNFDGDVMEGVYETVERDGYTEIYQIPSNVDPSQYTIEEVVYIYPENQSQAPLPGSYMQPPPAYVQAVPYNNYTYASSFPINTPPPQPVFPHMNAAPAPIPQPRPYVEQPRPMPPTCLAPYVLQPSPSMVYNLLQPPPPPPPPLPPPSIPPPLPPSGQLPVVSHPNISFPPNSMGYYHGSQPSFPTYHTGRLQNSIVQRLSQPARETSSPSNYVKSCNLRNLTEVQTTDVESPRHNRDAPTEKVNYELESQQIPSLQRSACVASDVGWHRPLQGTLTYRRRDSVSNLVPLRQDEMPSAIENSITSPSDVEKPSTEVVAKTVHETEEGMDDSTRTSKDERSEEPAFKDYPRSTEKEKEEVDFTKDSYPDDSSDSGDSMPPFTAPLTPSSSISTVSRGFQNSRNPYYPHGPPFRMVQPATNNSQFHNARHSFPPMRRPHRFSTSAPRLMYQRGNRF